MDVTVKDILALPELRECRLLRRDVSCERVVKSITIMDNPDILDWMSEYEILFSNGSSLVDLNILEWKAFFAGLVAKKAACLFIKLRYHIQTIPEEVVRYATSLDFPIVVVPNNYSLVRLGNPIQGFMIERQFYFLNESMNLRNELNRAMTCGATADDICEIVSNDMNCRVAFFSSADWKQLGGQDCSAWETATDSIRMADSAIPRKSQPGSLGDYSFDTDAGKVVFTKLPDRAGRYYSAYCLDVDSASALELDAFKIEQVNAALLLCISKEEELRCLERRYYLEFLSELLDGSLSTDESIVSWTKRLGRNVHQVYQLVVVRGLGRGGEDSMPRLVSLFKQSIHPAVRDIMCCMRDGAMVLFCPVLNEEDEETVFQGCDIMASLFEDDTLAFGVSTPYPLKEMYRAVEEASFACSVQILTGARIAFYRDLGLLRLFERETRQETTRFMCDYYEKTIGPLVSYDAEYGSDLMVTLKAYFDCNGSIGAAAKSLFVHENTLRMRIKRIEALTGRSLKTSLGSTELYLGVLMDDLIARPTAG